MYIVLLWMIQMWKQQQIRMLHRYIQVRKYKFIVQYGNGCIFLNLRTYSVDSRSDPLLVVVGCIRYR